jgi:hypothetical protein
LVLSSVNLIQGSSREAVLSDFVTATPESARDLLETLWGSVGRDGVRLEALRRPIICGGRKLFATGPAKLFTASFRSVEELHSARR